MKSRNSLWHSISLSVVFGLSLVCTDVAANPWHSSIAGIVPEGEVLTWGFWIDLSLVEYPPVPPSCSGSLNPVLSIDESRLPAGAISDGSDASWQTAQGDKGLYPVSAIASWGMSCCASTDEDGNCISYEQLTWFTLGSYTITGQVLGQVKIESIEPTQSIQVLQPIDDMGGGAALSLVAGKETVIRIYLSEVPVQTRVKIAGELTIFGTVIELEERELTLAPFCDTDTRRARDTDISGGDCERSITILKIRLMVAGACGFGLKMSSRVPAKTIPRISLCDWTIVKYRSVSQARRH